MSVQDDFRKKQKPVNVRAVFDIVMGLVYVVMGGILAAAKYAGFEFSFIRQEFVFAFAAFAVLYGAFRIFRGIKTYNLVDK